MQCLLQVVAVQLHRSNDIWHDIIYSLFNVFFFFHEEDGIRDTSVTGVQTCALPICLPWACCWLPGCSRSLRRQNSLPSECARCWAGWARPAFWGRTDICAAPPPEPARRQ